MAKILIIEDSEIQRNWAKEELAEHEVTFLEYFSEEIEDLLAQGNYDLALTDLILPPLFTEKIGKPSTHIGKWSFKLLLKKYAENLVKGVALVSNFEHHLDRNRDVDLREGEVKDWFSFIKLISRKVGEKKKENQANILIWVDSPVSCYEYARTADGIKKSLKENGVKYPSDLIDEWGEITLLKPWKKIVSTLLME